MHELTITPEGHLLVRETALDTSDRKPSKRLLEAYGESSAHGMLFSATVEMDAALPPPFEFARSIARLYLTNLCHAAIAEPGGAVPELPPPSADLERAVLQAPPMTGLEYLSEPVLSNWWRDLDSLARSEIKSHPDGTQGYLRERNPQWRYVGRVTLHLAENKRNPDYPFAFLATFANGLTPQGKVKHEPLGRALHQYAGEQNREAMLNLLLPISRAAESSDLIRELVDSGEIYHPLAWSPREAYEFLKAIPLLESSGLIVRVPDWWNAQKPARARVSVKVDTKGSAGIGVDSLLDFSVGVSLEGETLSPDEIDQLLESSGGLIPLKGKWVEVDSEKLNEALTHWKRVERDVHREGISFFEGMRLLSGANLTNEGEEESAAAIREWTGLTAGAELDSVLKGLRSPESRLEKAPPELKAELRPYQLTGYSWLRFVARLGLGACLADDMGLGKTVQVIALLLDLKREPSNNQKKKDASLLVVPASLIANWKSELGKFAPSLAYGVVHPSEANAKGGEVGPADLGAFDLIVTTYGMLARTAWLKRHRWRLLILDEAQAIKNSGTKQTRAVKELAAGARIAMTGTPVENRLSDLWSLFDFLNPGLLGTAKQFGTFVKRLQSDSAPSFEPLRNLVRPYILRRMKTDKRVIADLPDKTEVKAFCSLSKHQAALYQKAVDELSEQLESSDGMQRRGIVLTQLMRLKQICNHPAQVTGTNEYRADRSGKFQRLAEIAEEIASRQEKMLVFTQFREITEPLAEFLATLFGRPGLVLHGGTSVPKRKQYVDRFQREDGPPFFVLSLKAGGTGLNLTSASHVVHFDRWWNPAIENQATDRAFRIGQKKNVLVHKFICRGTVEERIDEMIMRKTQVADEAVGGSGSAEVLLTEMDDDALLQFVKLDLRQAIDA
ncbi:non-specific serine/threonine protein kinase [Singulisphaera sp. GP187]|uniref:DEAD/DEAH box helicase n=1 Tax=Singulisphaera sp. GP187 TaxID=1882752 RepID=UPI00092B478B|nr:DEAD/DEAH box helicase [Singulisphaera sp. GP187]SIO40300.1 non-specific serine/threonine protein kinase [Singulisphaera sp. GP187]